MTDEKRIPLARTVRWRRIRLRVAPIVMFLVATAACAWLWERRGAAVHGVGEVDSLRIDVTSPAAGLIVALPHQSGGQWTLYDHVRAGDVLARFDDRKLQLSTQLLLHEIEQLIEELHERQATSGAGADADTSEAVQRAWQYELARLAALEQSLIGESASSGFELASTLTDILELQDVPAAARSGLAEARLARQRLELRVEELALERELLEIRAPLSGTLVAVHCWPGQAVPQGGLVATIAADHGRHIVSYLPEDSSLALEAGMQVTVRSRQLGSRRITSEIEEVGRQIEPIPPHQLSTAAAPQWGMPVRIKLPREATWRPGALVDVVFHRTREPEADGEELEPELLRPAPDL